MLQAGRDAWFDESKVLESARFVWEELPRRLARRLLDLQLLPYIVVTNPHIDTVYKAYLHAFNVIRASRPPENMKENEEFALLLRRLVDEHGEGGNAPNTPLHLSHTTETTSDVFCAMYSHVKRCFRDLFIFYFHV